MKHVVDNKDFKQFLTVRAGLSANSIRHTLSRVKLFYRWLGRQPLTSEKVEAYLYSLKEQGRNNNTINTYVFAFRQLEAYLRHRGKNTNLKLKSLPKHKTSIDVLTLEEIKKILNTRLSYGSFRGLDCDRLNDTFLTFTAVLATTGARFSEVAKLESKHVGENSLVFEETKNREWRKIFISSDVKRKIDVEIKRGGKTVFTTMNLNPLTSQTYNADLKLRAKKAGITKRVHPHLFRHSFATQLLSDGVEITRVATILGHKDIQTTYKNYVHLADKAIVSAVKKHPLVMASIDPAELIQEFIKVIETFNFSKDPRFATNVSYSEKSLEFDLKVDKITP